MALWRVGRGLWEVGRGGKGVEGWRVEIGRGGRREGGRSLWGGEEKCGI